MTALVIIIFNFNGDVNNDKQFTYGKINVQSVVNYNSEEVVSKKWCF